MNLTSDQQQVANEIFKIFCENKQNEIILSGPAGTGKTHLVKYIITDVVDKYKKTCKLLNITPRFNTSSIVITATTNKAVTVLKQFLPLNHLPFNYPIKTIESALGLVVTGDLDKGTYKLKPNPYYGKSVYQNALIIIDEASMINKYLYKFIKECCPNSFIIYVGDDCQLPAVKDGNIPFIFSIGIPEYKLTSLVRQGNKPDLISLSNEARDTVYTNKFKPIKLTQNIHWVKDPEKQKEILKGINILSGTKILTYTNSKSILYNEYIMSNLHGKSSPLYEDERYIVNSFYKTSKNIFIPAECEIYVRSIRKDPIVYTFKDSPCELIVFDAEVMGRFYCELMTPKNPEYFFKWLKYIAKFQEWDYYFKYKESVVDIRGSYASTIHKSQGSTFNKVIIDADDFKRCTNPSLAARLLYVAVSRAKEEVIFFGDLPKKYGEFIC